MKHLRLTEELQEQASLYASGAMPESERLEYARHLEEDDCAVCRAELREFQAAAHLMALSLPSHRPSPAAKSRVMAQAELTASPPGTARDTRRRWTEWAAGLAAVTAAALLIAVFNQNVELRREAESLNNRVAQLEAQLGQQQLMLATLTSPEVRVVNLAGQGPTPMADGRIFWDQARRRWLFYVQDLPPVPADRSYQLWFVPTAGPPVSATVFNTSPDGSANIEVPVPETITELQAAAVTTEPAGGLPQPSGPFALLGALN